MNTRRDFLAATVGSAIAASVVQSDEPAPPGKTIERLHKNLAGKESVAIVLYDGFTALDVFGPHHLFTSLIGAQVHLVSLTLDPVKTDTRISVQPTMTVKDCPADLTVLFVPGGTLGTLAAAENPEIRQFVADRGKRAKWVTSVCTGSLVLGAAGLLKGFKATSHWLARDVLAEFGATPVNERVVIDRNRVTGAGVTSGIDFGLTLVGKLRGTEYAQAVQLFSEYDPRPPYNAGSPDKAPKEIVHALRQTHVEFTTRAKAMAARLRDAND